MLSCVKNRILILEDDVDLAEGIAMSLQSQDMEFVLCRTIAEAGKELKDGRFDLLIFDINLPDGNGLSFCKEIKPIVKVPIALLTAKDMELDIVKGLESGADDYITKPFSLMVLRARIRALLRRNDSGFKQKYEDGVDSFHFDTMEFYVRNKAVELSKTEQKILNLLVENPNRIISRGHILDFVWGDGSEYVEDNALSVSIKRLREKLEDDGKNPKHIKTVYGKGYKWECFSEEE